jgi:hypothetical protein
MKTKLTFLSAACSLLLAIPLAAAGKANPANATAVRSAWPAETLSGKITMVDPVKNLVVVETADGVPFDMVLTPRTRIESGQQRVTIQDLSGDVNRNVSVRFVPERRGDVARSMEIGG